jgi:integrase
MKPIERVPEMVLDDTDNAPGLPQFASRDGTALQLARAAIAQSRPFGDQYPLPISDALPCSENWQPSPYFPEVSRGLTDTEAAAIWMNDLEQRGRSSATLRAYGQEVTRLFWAAQVVLGKSPADWTMSDLSRYFLILKDPPADLLQKRGASTSKGAATSRVDGRARPIATLDTNVSWSPLRRPLSPSSVAHSRRILMLFFEFCISIGHIRTNPLRLVHTPRGKAPDPRARVLSLEQVSLLLSAIDRRPKGSIRDVLTAARDRWVISLLTGTGLRVEEALAARMQDIYASPADPGVLLLRVQSGKGGKRRDVPANGIENALEEYCRALGTTRESMKPETPLILQIRSDTPLASATPITSGMSVGRLVKRACAEAAEWLEEVGQRSEARKLRSATTHWLRHTYATILADAGLPMEDLAENMGHASIETTRSIYVASDTAKRANRTNRILKRPV